MLILLKDKTIIPVLKQEQFEELSKQDDIKILEKLYVQSERGKYILKKDIGDHDAELLYKFMDEYNYRHQPFTILAVEEPEAHLHPTLQRLIYKEVLQNSNTSVIFTSHSTHLTSITPLDYIVHIRKMEIGSKLFSTINLSLSDREKRDIERYIDAKRGEIYFGKGIILVEGITEEYIIPAAAELIGSPLDQYGVVVCNIDSTNFKPYIQLLQKLNIPWVLCTDGDYYEIEDYKDAKGIDKKRRVYHILDTKINRPCGYAGDENINKILYDLEIVDNNDISNDELKENGCFVGIYTLEVDMMLNLDIVETDIIKGIFNDLKKGKEKMQQNFENRLDAKDYWAVLDRIEGEISKGRFAQRLATELTIEFVPAYVQECITEIVKKVTADYE